MPQVITIAGESLITQKQQAGLPLGIDKFVFGNILGLDPALAIDRNEGLPLPGEIVHQPLITQDGYITPNMVVYSQVLDTTVGDFDFNWIGLYNSVEGVVVAISHVPLQQKRQTTDVQDGNNITRNFMMRFDGAQDITGISVAASSWQIDFSERLRSGNNDTRRASQDIYGDAVFFDGAALVTENIGSYEIGVGVGYIKGLRADLALDSVTPVSLPTSIWLDVSQQGDPAGAQSTVVTLVADAAVQADYTDLAGINHYLAKVADVAADTTITDTRNVSPYSALIDKVDDHIADTAPHGATSAATAERLLIRDPAGRAKMAAPSADDDVARLLEVKAVIPAGSIMLFQQTAAPVGWTKLITHNDKALRVVSGAAGSGGTSSFTTMFGNRTVSDTTAGGAIANTTAGGSISNTIAGGSLANTTAGGTVGNTTLSASQMPSHTHNISSGNSVAGGGVANFIGGVSFAAWQPTTGAGSSTSHGHTFTGAAHAHTFTGTSHAHAFTGAAHNHSFSGSSHNHTLDMRVQYVDLILASKN